DIMDRTQGDPNFVVARPWVQVPSNCVVPVPVAEAWLNKNPANTRFWELCGPGGPLTQFDIPIVDPATGRNYDPNYYNGANGTTNINGGAGIPDDLSGAELPNSPHWTMNVGAQYSRDFLEGWRATLRADAYWQSQSWARVYNDDPYDKL